MLLCEQGYEIQMSIAVEISRQHVDRASFLDDQMILICFVGFVFQPPHLALVNGAIRGDHEIRVTIAIKIARLDIRHTADLVQDGHRRKLHRALVGQQHNASHQIVAWPQGSEAANDNIHAAIALPGQYLRMCGIADCREHVFLPDSIPVVNPRDR